MVRNFWLDADIDGRKTELTGGPRSKDGWMDVDIYQRDEGQITNPINIRCRAYEDGTLCTKIYVNESLVKKVVTKR